MTEFRKGDRVRVAEFTATVWDEYRPGLTQLRVHGDPGDLVISTGALTLIERADPLDEVRRVLQTALYPNEPPYDVKFLAQEAVARLTEAQKPREPWTGDGPEEPPAHVKKVRDRHGDIAQRNVEGRWCWVQISGHAYSLSQDGWPLSVESAGCGPFTEVRD